MLFQAGGQGTRPTFLIMEAAQQLPASPRATLTYSISVLALRRPFTGFSTTRTSSSPCSCTFSKLIAYELQAHASFFESLYGLRRRAVKIKAMRNDESMMLD
ncbi:hypothetical protein FF1_044237 [Malus domestica]